jgi:hypothetical protein
MKSMFTVGAALLVIGAFLLDWRFFSMTGHLFPKKIVDSLNAPVRIIAVKETGLVTSEGKTLVPPLIARLLLHPDLTKDILGHGVELKADGTIYVLVRVHHWCGNDPVRFHLARVDLSSLMLALEHERGFRFSEFDIDPALLMLARLPHPEVKRFYDENEDKGSPNDGDATNGSQPFE